MFDSPNPSLNDLRLHLQRAANPDAFSRWLTWIMGWFLGREFREMMRQAPDVRPYFDRQIGIIDAMTPTERTSPAMINFYRACRIARGSGTHPNEVRELVAWYYRMLRASGELGMNRGK